MVTHPSTNRASRRVSSLMCPINYLLTDLILYTVCRSTMCPLCVRPYGKTTEFEHNQSQIHKVSWWIFWTVFDSCLSLTNMYCMLLLYLISKCVHAIGQNRMQMNWPILPSALGNIYLTLGKQFPIVTSTPVIICIVALVRQMGCLCFRSLNLS